MNGSRSIRYTAVLLSVLISAGCLAGDEGYGNRKLQLAILGLDLGLTSVAVLTLLSQRNAASDYEELYAGINGTTLDNYRLLAAEESKLEDKTTAAVMWISLAGAAVGYTIADAFWLRSIFRVKGSRVGRHNGRLLQVVAYERRF